MAQSVDVQKDFNSIPILGLVPEQVTADIGTAVEGRLFTRTDLHELRVIINGLVKTLTLSDDSRLTDSRPPNGGAGGDLEGSYPGPTIKAQAITALKIDDTLKPSAGAASTVESLRRLGLGNAAYAMPGTASLDQLATSNPVAADISFSNFKLTNVATPTSSGDAANKNYVDSVAQGLNAKASVRAASPGNVSFTSGTPSAPSSLDGVSLATGDRLLLKNQSTAANNGIWVVVQVGTGGNGVWQRAEDANSAAELRSAFTFVEEGTTHQNTGWVQTADNITLGSTAITWAQFSQAGAYSAGNGLSLAALDLSVNVDSTTIWITSDTLSVKPGGITGTELAVAAVDLAGTKVTNTLPLGKGGTGGTTAPTARAGIGATGRATVASPALTAGTWTDVVHNLGVTAVAVIVKVASTGEMTELGIRDKVGSETTTIQIKTDIPGGRTAGFYNVGVVG